MREGVDGGEEDRKNSLERATSFPLSPLFRADTALEMQTWQFISFVEELPANS